MKHSEMLNLNLPEDNDLINVGHLSGNFEKIDSAFQTLPVKQNQSKTDIDVMACPPYWTMHNATDEDIVYIDHNFFDEEFTLEAGQTITNEIEEPVNIRISSEVTIDYTWFIPASEAFSGGGGGGTSDYNKLTNLPTINNVEIKNNKTADDLGLVAKEKDKGLSTNDFTNAYKSQLDDLDDALDAKLNANSVGAAGGVAELGSDGKVPSSQLPDPVAQKEYRIAEEASTSYAKVYKLQQKNGETWSDISGSEKINIPKDMVVESGSVKECTTDNVPVSGYKKGDKYIDLVIANKSDAHIYINVKDLIDNKAEGIQYSNITSELTATNVQSAIDEIAETLKDKVDETELLSAIDGVKTNILSTIVASSNASTSNAKTLDFQGTGKNLEKLVVEGKTVQDGTPSPSNPIEVKGVGDKIWNVLNLSTLKAGRISNGNVQNTSLTSNITITDGTLKFTTTAGWGGVYGDEYIPCSAGDVFYYGFDSSSDTSGSNDKIRMTLALYDENKTYIAMSAIVESGNTITISSTSTAKYARPTFSKEHAGMQTLTNIRLLKNSVSNGYLPYSENPKYKIPISCAGKSTNIYLNAPLFNGEKADVVNGVAEKKYGIKVFDGSESWEYRKTSGTNYNYFILNDIGVSNVKKNVPVTTNIVKGTSVEPAAENAYISSGGALAIFTQNAGNTADAFKEFLRSMNSSGNPVYMIYPLVTPTKETFEAPEIATVTGKNTLTVGTDVTPTKIEVTSFGEYYSKAQIDKMLNGEWVDVDVSNVVPRDTAAGYSVDLTGNNRIRFKMINNIIYVDIQLKIRCTDPNVVSIYFKNVVPQQFFSNTAKVLPSRMSNWVNANDNYRGLAWFQVDPNTNAISISLADNKKMVTANGMLFNCYSNYFVD